MISCSNSSAGIIVRRFRLIAVVLLGGLLSAALSVADEKAADEKAAGEKTTAAAKADADGWQPLFNGKDLDGWKVTNFGGEGDVLVENGDVVITQGADLSGIHTEKKLPKSNYEVQFEAQREAGGDFFAGLTFPIRDSFCSLIIGGWGGGVCGISSLDGMDASENDTTTYQQFDKGRWYRVRLVVRDNHISAWIDDNQIVDVDTTDRRIGVRFEVERSKPFGFATYATTGRIRKARIRSLPPESAGATKSTEEKSDKN
ncbi:MAG: DUF1080 domain-containing protein [Planctomyces sp.]|jgi:hypothetical protein|nr:DUF1080 domain-containing protein [Planctomyces sp.]